MFRLGSIFILALAGTAACGGSKNQQAKAPSEMTETTSGGATMAQPENGSALPSQPVSPQGAAQGQAPESQPSMPPSSGSMGAGSMPQSGSSGMQPSGSSGMQPSGSSGSMGGGSQMTPPSSGSSGSSSGSMDESHQQGTSPSSGSMGSSPSSGSSAGSMDAPSTPAQDQKITQSVHRTLMADKTLSSPAGVKITTTSGKVTLKGTVSSDDEKDRIENEVKKVPGVQSVDNELKVQKK
jgi:hypothetical protein